jgi:predicted RNA binding protein YcfA (HicA-like mRNA interferase family)
MTKLPSLKAREITRGLENLGFEKVRQKGSHAIFHHPDCRRATIPIHPTEEISPYFISDILKHLHIDEEKFLEATGKKQS